MSRFTRISGVVYDLDGTIVDSASVHAKAWRAAGKKYKVKITSEFLEFQKGKTNEEAAGHLLDPLGKATILNGFVSEKIRYANQHAGESKYFYDFTLAYQWFQQKHIPVWICTSSPRQFCLNVYKKFTQLKRLSRCTIWREKYKKGKGEGLLLAFKEMEIAAKDGLYIGDAWSDWKAAEEAGCQFVAYRNPGIAWHWDLLSLLS